MIPVSQEFHQRMRALDRRKILGRVEIDYTDPFLDQSIDVTTNDQANTSYPQQTADNVADPTYKYAALDGTWVLGQDWALAPGPDELNNQMGWWGRQLAGTGGLFAAPYPKLTVTFFTRPIWMLKVVGDSKRQEWPVDFNIYLYDETDNLLYTETVIGNTDIAWQKDVEVVNNVAKMELEIRRWSHEGRQVKILEFFSSIKETYEGDDIMLINLLEERDVSGGSLPIGNISSNEIEIHLSNFDRRFDAGNTSSPLYGLVRANRRIRAWLGIEKDDGTKEWVPLGTFWSGDWTVREDRYSVKTTGRDRLELLRNTIYRTNQVQINRSLYDLAIDVLQDAGVNEVNYWVDPELQTFIVPYAYFEPQSHRDALRTIAEACLGSVYCDRNGILRIEGPSYMEAKIQEKLGTYFLESTYPAEIEGIEAYGIGPDDYFMKDNPAKGSEIANHIEVETQPLRPVEEIEIYRSNESISIKTGERKTITITFNEVPCIDVNLQLEGTGQIESANIYAWGADVTVASEEDGSFVIIATGKPLKVLNKEKAIARDEKSIRDNGERQYKFSGNPLIQTLSIAQTIANKLLQYYKEPRRDLSLEWRGNPALELGDLIVVADYQRGKTDQRGFYYITKQEIEYAGSLRARLEGRRAL